MPTTPRRLLGCAITLLALSVPAPAGGGSITTLFDGSAGVQNGGNLFDVQVTRPGGLLITGFDINLGGMPPPGTFSLDVYITPQSYLGVDATPSAWTLVASATGSPLSPNVPVRVDTPDFALPMGFYGIALYIGGNGPWYTLPGSVALEQSNADLHLRFGISKPLLFSGGSFGPRVWNGTIYYDTPPPPLVNYGLGRTSSLGGTCVPSILSSGVLSAGASEGCLVFGWRVPSHQAGLLMYSTQGRANLPFRGGRLLLAPPVRRTVAVNSGGLAPGLDCWGRFSLDLAAFSQGQLGGHPAPALRIPGALVTCQWWGRDPGFAPPNDALLSNGLELLVMP
jgi:hypothetical protein